jgi:hypothetical protein
MEFISGTSQCNHCRAEQLAVGARVADDADKTRNFPSRPPADAPPASQFV